MKHNLTDSQNGKVFNISLSGNKVITESGKPGKTKETEKEFANEKEAAIFFEKKEWEMLKKGFLMKNPEASEFEPMLHYFMGSGYTGCLSLVNIGDSFAVYELTGDKNSYKFDCLQFIDNQGILLNRIELPKVFPWAMLWHKEKNLLFIDLDHFIYSYNIGNNTFTKLTDTFVQPGSFISMSEKRIAFGADPKIYVLDLDTNKILFEQEVKSELYSGHSTQFKGGISKNGKKLAICTHSGLINIHDIDTGKTEILNGDFQMVEAIEFIDNDKVLLLKEKYGSWGFRFFSIATKEELSFPGLKIPKNETLVNHFAINEDATKLVAIQYKTAYLFDLLTKQFLNSFDLSHIVRTAKPAFGKGCIGFRTDYGCFSVYKI
jgi:WD40 repeat protein